MKLPTCWSDLDNIPEEFYTTNTGEALLMFDKIVDTATGTKILGFTSPSLIAVLKGATEISVDGTFDITKWTLFSQVLNIC